MIPRAKHLRALILGATLGVGLVATSFAPTRAVAQADLGSVSGAVTDASGAVIPKAQVTITNNENGAVRTSVTNARGEYAVTQMVPGLYTVQITATGFAPASQVIAVTVGSSNTVSAKLAVSGGKTEVVVQADNFAGVQLDKPEISAVIETNQILNLPTPDRDPYALVKFSGNMSSDPLGGNRGVGFNISGGRSASVDILLDGVENTDMFGVGVGQNVPMDATSEIRVVTSNSGAEYGRGSGAVNVSTKSGTNGFHGSVYEYNRISTLGSDGYNNNYLHALNGTNAKPRYTHNQFGYSVGGPVKKDKLFFFSSTEWTRIRSAQQIVAVVPTDSFLSMTNKNTQDFFSTYGKLSQPINGKSYTGADVQNLGMWTSDINTIALQEAGLASDTKLTGGCADAKINATAICTTKLFGQSIYQAPTDSGGGTPENQWISFNRADWTINQTTSLFVRYIQQSTVQPDGTNVTSPYAGYSTGSTQYNHGLELSLSKAFTNSLASATKVLGSRLNNKQPLSTAPVGPTLYVNSSSAVGLGGAGTINFPGYSQTAPGNAIPFGGPQNFIDVGEDLAWTKGKHQFSFGGTFLYTKDNRAFGAYQEAVDALVQSGTKKGLINFVGGNIGFLNVAVDPKGTYPCSRDVDTGGIITTDACKIKLPVSSPNFTRSNRFHDFAFYASDTYRVTPKFTLNLGVRWEIYGPQHSQKKNYDANFFFGDGSTYWDRIRGGQVKTRETASDGRLWNLNLGQVAPKVGFAFDPFGNGKTSIRGGVGISYERNFGNVTFNVIQNPPNYAVVAFTAADNGGVPIPISTNNFSTFGTGTGLKALPPVTLRAVDPKIKPAYSGNWSLSIERQFGDTTASVSYVGTRGIHNYSIYNLNRSFSGVVYNGDNDHTCLKDGNGCLSNRSNLQYSNVNFRGADGDSYYHGVTAELRSSNLFKTGLTTRADYTFAHSIDNTSSTFGDNASNVNYLGYLDPNNKALDRGSSDFDQRQRVAVTMFWAIPFGKTASAMAKPFVDGWTLSTTMTAQTGNPFTMWDCYYGVTGCARVSFVHEPKKDHSRNLIDLSKTQGANTFSYMTMPRWDDPATGALDTTHYNGQMNPAIESYYWDWSTPLPSNWQSDSSTWTAGSDTPVCSGPYNQGCHFVKHMSGRNAFLSPGSWNEDFAILKDFKIRERYDIQLKGEFINMFNHANTYMNLPTDISTTTEILAYKSGNRNTQLSLHVAF